MWIVTEELEDQQQQRQAIILEAADAEWLYLHCHRLQRSDTYKRHIIVLLQSVPY